MFQPLQINKNEPTYRPRSKSLEDYECFQNERQSYYIAKPVLRDIAADAIAARPNETIGRLIGRSFRDNAGAYTVVCASQSAENARRQPSFVETTLGDEIATTTTIEQRFPTAERVGWYHSHPCGTTQYSGTDRENQRLECPGDSYLGILASVNRSCVTLRVLGGRSADPVGSPYAVMISDVSQSKTEECSARGLGTASSALAEATPSAWSTAAAVVLLVALVWTVAARIDKRITDQQTSVAELQEIATAQQADLESLRGELTARDQEWEGRVRSLTKHISSNSAALHSYEKDVALLRATYTDLPGSTFDQLVERITTTWRVMLKNAQPRLSHTSE